MFLCQCQTDYIYIYINKRLWMSISRSQFCWGALLLTLPWSQSSQTMHWIISSSTCDVRETCFLLWCGRDCIIDWNVQVCVLTWCIWKRGCVFEYSTHSYMVFRVWIWSVTSAIQTKEVMAVFVISVQWIFLLQTRVSQRKTGCFHVVLVVI